MPLRKHTIFVCYRADETGPMARLIVKELSHAFGPEAVFHDRKDVKEGGNFRARIHTALSTVFIVLVLVGKEWLTIKDEKGARRLDAPNDFLRTEIEQALADERISVLPVLVDGAPRLRLEELPASIAEIADLVPSEVHERRFDPDIEALIATIRAYLPKCAYRLWPRVRLYVVCGMAGLFLVAVVVLDARFPRVRPEITERIAEQLVKFARLHERRLLPERSVFPPRQPEKSPAPQATPPPEVATPFPTASPVPATPPPGIEMPAPPAATPVPAPPPESTPAPLTPPPSAPPIPPPSVMPNPPPQTPPPSPHPPRPVTPTLRRLIPKPTPKPSFYEKLFVPKATATPKPTPRPTPERTPMPRPVPRETPIPERDLPVGISHPTFPDSAWCPDRCKLFHTRGQRILRCTDCNQQFINPAWR